MASTTAPHLLTREEIECHEVEWLASYAMKSQETKGRQYPEREDPHRTVYRRDRDRIIHTTAFRRLEYKTQVFVNHEGDHYRTRLTHTVEVAQIAVSIARILRLNEDLVEAVALAHDLGHPPFGHAGEDALRDLMEGHGGFDHNLQGLRIVEQLEARYPDFPGLNLTWEVRDGINKHRVPYASTQGTPIDPHHSPLLESQLVDIADEIAYDNHDLDDGLASGILKEEGLSELVLWREAQECVASRTSALDQDVHRYQIIRTLINRQINDLVQTTVDRLHRDHIRTVDEVCACAHRLVDFSESMHALRRPLKAYLWQSLYRHYRVVRMADKAKRFISELFTVYLDKPEQLPTTTRSRLTKGEDPHRVVCDYLAGMTDRYCLEEYKKLFDPFERV